MSWEPYQPDPSKPIYLGPELDSVTSVMPEPVILNFDMAVFLGAGAPTMWQTMSKKEHVGFVPG